MMHGVEAPMTPSAEKIIPSGRFQTQRALDFIYIGTPKAGSTWLFEALGEHPQVQLFPSKSSKFFETSAPGPIAHYQRQLDGFSGERRIGEISHDVYLYAGSAALLRKHFPEVKIVVCLREPGDFARSLILWLRAHTLEYGNNPHDMMANPKLRAWMDYHAGLAPFFREFPRDQILVTFFDDFESDPRTFYSEICRHIGIDVSHEPASIDRIVNPLRAPRFPLLTRTGYHVGGILRALGFGPFVEAMKRSSAVQKILYAGHQDVDPAVLRCAMLHRERARKGLDSLESLIGQPLPERWRKI